MMPNNTSWIPSVILWIIAGLWFLATLIYIWKHRKYLGGKKMENEDKLIIKDSKFHAKVTDSDKASAMEVNKPALLSNVEAHLEANNVKDAAAFRTNQGLTAILTSCSNCGQPIPIAMTGRMESPMTVKCPRCGKDVEVLRID